MNPPAEASLLAKTASGAGWVVGFRLVTRLLGIVSTLTLVRILAPADFGLVALGTGFAQTVDAMSNLSVHEALVRERTPDRVMYNTAFTMNLIRGLLTGGLVAAAAGPVANFFHEPRLAAVLLALAVSSLIAAVENIATADFVRNMDFSQEFRLWTLPRVLQVIVTITCALIWRSYWALVAGIIFGRVIRTVMSYLMRPYMPGLTLSAWRPIFGFTSWTWAIYMVAIARERTDTTLIGRFFSSAQVGIYSLGNEIANLPIGELIDPLCRACFPNFLHLRHAGQDVGPTYLRVLAASALLVLPAGMGLALVADPLVRLAFGPLWLEAVPMIQLLGLSAGLGVIGSLTMTLFSAYGMLRTTFAIITAGMVVRAVLMIIFLPGGTLVTAVIVSILVGTVEQATFLGIVVHRFAVPVVGLLRAIWRSLLGAGVMTACLIWFGLGLVRVETAFLLHLLVTAAIGATIYGAVVIAAWLAVGHPDGPERDMLTLAGSVLRRLGTFRPA